MLDLRCLAAGLQQKTCGISTMCCAPPLCTQFDRLVPNAWRIVNSNDAVTLVPRMLGYCHIGHKAELRSEGQLELSRESAQLACTACATSVLCAGHCQPDCGLQTLLYVGLQATAARIMERGWTWAAWRLQRQ